jgi:hypothetical protein
MLTLICIDDTDILGSRGTGALASELIADIQNEEWGKCSPISRHQLFVHPDIPFTSHNSAMCFEADIDEKYLDTIIAYGRDFLVRESADGSDPGFCVAVPDRLVEPGLLLAYGYRCKQAVIPKDEAYALAEQLGIHLSEHGGTGQGVIGALAGVGLRLGGSDGRIRGKYHIAPPGSKVTVAEILDKTGVDLVKSTDGHVLSSGENVRVGEKVKSVLHHAKNVLLVRRMKCDRQESFWETCPRDFLSRY